MHPRWTRGIARLAVIALVAAALTTLAPQAAAPVAADGNEAPGAPLAFRSITAGIRHNCAIRLSGAVKCWGLNSSGQLGQGSTSNLGDEVGEMAALPAVNLGAGRTGTAVTAGGGHTCALLDDGTVKCWGFNSSGQLGQGSTSNLGDEVGEMAALPAVNLGAGRTATAVTAGYSHTCALLDDGTVKCWGENLLGQLGQGSTNDLGDGVGEMAALPAVNLGAGRTASAVTAGYSHTCALLDNGTVKCWGDGHFGQLGQGSTSTLGDGVGEMAALPAVNLGAGRTASAVTAGTYATCALLDDATVKCWGVSSYGRLGQGPTSNLGDGVGEMAALPPVDLGAGRTARAIATGSGHTCALLDNGTLKCWGLNSSGQLGQDSTSNLGDGVGEMAALPAVNLGSGRTATAVTAGYEHTCASLDDGTLECWGLNDSGQLGQGSTVTVGGQVGDMVELSPIFFVTPALSVQMSADESSVTVGDAVHLHVKVTNTGNVALTNVAISDVNAPNCEAAPFAVGVGADHSVDCTHVATADEVAGGYHNSASVVSTEVTTPVVSDTVDVAVAAAPSSEPLVFLSRWGSFGAGAGQFQNPYGVAVDGTGNVYVADTYNNRVQVFTSTGAFVRQWGSAGSGEGQFSSPAAVAVDASGNVYVADYANNRVQKFTSAGVFLASWGGAGSGDGQLSYPSGVAVGPSGDVYVADTFNQRIQEFTSAGTFVRKWGSGGSGQGQFSYPFGVAVDGAGNVYVADTFNQRVQKFSPTGTFRTTWGSGGSGDGQFSYPMGLTADAGGNVYVTDTSNSRIERFTASGAFVSKWGSRGSGDGQLDSPRGVAVDSSGHVFVADTNNSRVQQFATAPPPAPALSVTMSADESSVTVGDTVHLHVKVTNTGNVALTDVAITDANAPGCEAAPFALAVGADHGVDCTHVATADEVTDGYHNSAAVASTEVTTPVVSNTVDVTVTPVPAPGLDVAASADQVSVAPGEAIDLHLVVSNTGNVALHGVTLSDPAAPDCADDGDFDLAVDTFMTIDCGYTTTGNDTGTYTSEASVTADEVTTPVMSNPVEVTVDDAVTVTLSADQSSVVAGQPIGYHVTVRNTSALTLNGLAIVDDAAPECAGGLGFGILAPGAQIVVNCTHVSAVADVGTFSSVATVDSAEIVAVESNQVDVTVAAPAPALTVTETADPAEVVAGEPIDLALTVTNAGNVMLHGITVADPSVPGCQVKKFDLAVGAHRTVFCTHMTTAEDVPIYQNMASVGADEITTAVDSNIVSVAVTIPAGEAHVAGTVTETGSGLPISGAVAVLLSPADFSPVAVATAGSSGHFSALADPGSYFVYAVDPADDHAGAFHGTPSLVAATADTTTDADVHLVSTRGAVIGQVGDDVTSQPVSGVLAISVDLDQGRPSAGAVTGADGGYRISGLRPGARLLEFVDLTGAHEVEFYDDVATPAGSSILSVIGAAQTTADAGLAARAAPVGGAHLAGQVSSTTGEPLEGVAVIAVHAADFSLAAGERTDASGNYDLDLDPGDYKVAFYDPTGAHGFEWNDDRGPDGMAGAATVTAGGMVAVDAALTPTTGFATGTVTEEGTGASLAGVAVFAIDASGAVVGLAPTGVDGTYALAGLPAGELRLRFVDLAGAHATEYFEDSPSYGGASVIVVAAGATTPDVDVELNLAG